MDLETLQNDGFIITSGSLVKHDFNDTSIGNFKWPNPNSEPAETKKLICHLLRNTLVNHLYIEFCIPSKTLLNVASEKLQQHLKVYLCMNFIQIFLGKHGCCFLTFLVVFLYKMKLS